MKLDLVIKARKMCQYVNYAVPNLIISYGLLPFFLGLLIKSFFNFIFNDISHSFLILGLTSTILVVILDFEHN